MRNKLLVIIVFSILMTACSKTTTTAIEEPTNDIQESTSEVDKSVLDPAIVKAIKIELGKSSDYELTEADLQEVTYLAIFEESVSSLDGISKLTNLRELHISYGGIVDISELALLTELVFIDISHCYIREIPDLSNCKQLESLYLSDNLIEDISSLSKIDNLKYLNLDCNPISYIKPLEDCVDLEFFSAIGNCILDYSNIEDKAFIYAFNEGAQVDFSQYVQVENRAKEFAASIPENLSDEEKLSIIYQYVIDTMKFDDSVRPYTAFGYAGLFNGKGVCGDYAEMFAILANHAGIESYVCSSETHAWNIAKIDGKYYHFDALWDEVEDEWKHFMVTTDYIMDLPDHIYDVNRYPVCE